MEWEAKFLKVCHCTCVTDNESSYGVTIPPVLVSLSCLIEVSGHLTQVAAVCMWPVSLIFRHVSQLSRQN